jgi:hypothetical protein
LCVAQNAPAISSKYKTLKLFLQDAHAAEHIGILQREDITLAQLPDLTQEQLVQAGLKVGTANRIYTLAQKFRSG